MMTFACCLLQFLPSQHLASIYKCLQTVQACAQIQVASNRNNLCHLCGNIATVNGLSLLGLHRFHRLGGFGCCLRCCLLCHAEHWRTEKVPWGMQMSLKTSFLEPDHTTSFASHCTWETNVMPNKHGHKAYHRAPQSGDRSEWPNKIRYLRKDMYNIYIYIYTIL